MTLSDILVIVLTLAGLIFCCALGSIIEYREFNHGICRYCGTRLNHFDIDSQGGRGYTCKGCGYCTWISYDFIDKGFEEDRVRNE